jgi:hypothetical protein
MPVQTASPALAKLYDEDFVLWLNRTARLLRDGRLDELDIEHLVEEIEAMAGNQRRELKSRLRVLLTHLLKWGWQRTKRSKSWKVTAANQRAELRDLLGQSPSLKRQVAEAIAESYEDALRQASLQTGLPRETFPLRCPFTPEQILDQEFFPE